MKTVHKSVLLWYGAAQMYALVTDVARYPEFLPWCDRSRVVALQDDGMTAEIGIAFGGVHQSFVTRNTHRKDAQVKLQLINGPFSELNGEWNFTPLELGDSPACRVDLTLNYGFSNALLSKLVGPVFDKIATSLVDAFVQRAEQVYGG